jgi:ketosteroid isomerase-like protein
MSTEENKALIRRYVEAINQQDYDVFDALLAPALLTETKQMVAATGHHLTITDMIAEGDHVWVRLVIRGEHTNEFEGVPPTGKPWTVQAAAFLRLHDGKIIASDGLFDSLAQLKQVGATITPPAQTGVAH